MTRAAALQIEKLHYFYKSDWTYKKTPVLHGLSLDVYEGETFGFLGPNGAGKTTTIKCLLGLIRPAAGSIKIFGTDSREPAAREVVGYLPEQPYFYDYLSVREMMEMYAALAGVKAVALDTSIKKALERVGLAHLASSRMRTLSKGLTQRVAMAQAIVASPKLLVLDEPFSGLDPIGRKEFKDLIFEIKHLGTTVFMSSHILSDVEHLCDRASIMIKGQLKGVYALDALRSSSSSTYQMSVRNCAPVQERLLSLSDGVIQKEPILQMVFHDSSKAKEALRMALDNNATIESFEHTHASLEDLFVDLVSSEKSREAL